MALYFRREWDESPGGSRHAWGTSVCHFETADDGTVLRQVEVYANGRALRYGPTHDEDEHGFLTYQPLDLKDFAPYKSNVETFERAWLTAREGNRE